MNFVSLSLAHSSERMCSWEKVEKTKHVDTNIHIHVHGSVHVFTTTFFDITILTDLYLRLSNSCCETFDIQIVKYHDSFLWCQNLIFRLKCEFNIFLAGIAIAEIFNFVHSSDGIRSQRDSIYNLQMYVQRTHSSIHKSAYSNRNLNTIRQRKHRLSLSRVNAAWLIHS